VLCGSRKERRAALLTLEKRKKIPGAPDAGKRSKKDVLQA